MLNLHDHVIARRRQPDGRIAWEAGIITDFTMYGFAIRFVDGVVLPVWSASIRRRPNPVAPAQVTWLAAASLAMARAVHWFSLRPRDELGRRGTRGWDTFITGADSVIWSRRMADQCDDAYLAGRRWAEAWVAANPAPVENVHDADAA